MPKHTHWDVIFHSVLNLLLLEFSRVKVFEGYVNDKPTGTQQTKAILHVSAHMAPNASEIEEMKPGSREKGSERYGNEGLNTVCLGQHLNMNTVPFKKK